MPIQSPVSDSSELSPQRQATQQRIIEAARRLFYEKGFVAPTMDEIARLTGIQRSTLYLYFKEKELILDRISRDYIQSLAEVIDKLPSPEPNRQQLADWVDEMVAFVNREPEATEILVSLTHLANAPAPAVYFGEAMRQLMADKLLAYQQAHEPGQGEALAWGVAALEELGWALCLHVRSGGGEHACRRLEVATELLNWFIAGNYQKGAYE